ncbi:hypothetical protein C882_1093 [Caenispirillum salinarum AK4]|uniref:Uncharacterized protein n=1 Tax=Caenispirillum salinarum AK4 TaxID=1238182 RepID=K9GSF3_9PROT|nr:hypothetical protein [Caenispirillum salinarum]EKV28092.1 hypothetical protein C882_1093 [Caenispirillum salinarum AK4]
MTPMLKTVLLTLVGLTAPAVALAQETTDSGLSESPDSPVLLLLLIGLIVLAFLGGGLWAMKRRARRKEGERGR